MSNRNFAQELDGSTDDDLHAEIFDMDLPPLPKPQQQIIEVVPDGAIVPAERGWLYRHFELTPVGVQIAEGTTEDEWLDLGGALFKLGSAIQWLLGDWLAFGEREYKKTYEEIAAATGYEVKTLRNFVYVCKSVNISLRKDVLKFGHHNLVAGFAPHKQDEWLEKAEVGKWSISQMREEIRKANGGNPPALSKEDVAFANFYDLSGRLGDTIRIFRASRLHRRQALERISELRTYLDRWEDDVKGQGDD